MINNSKILSGLIVSPIYSSPGNPAAVVVAGPPGTPTMILDRSFLTLTGSDIDEMDDQSGNAYDMVYVAGGVGKAQLSGGVTLDGDSTIRPQNNGFNEGSVYRSNGGVTMANLMPSNRLTVMAVLNVDSILALFGAPDHILEVNAGSRFPRIEAVNSGGPAIRFYWRSGTGDVLIDRNITLDTWIVVTARADGTDIKLQIDNGTEVTAASTNNTAVDGAVQMFYDGGDAGCFNGNLAYLATWDGAISAGDVTAAKAYLKDRWPSLNV